MKFFYPSVGTFTEGLTGLDKVFDGFESMLKKLIYMAADYYLMIGVIVVAAAVIVAVFSRKNKQARRKAIIMAVTVPVVCFGLYVAGFIFADVHMDGQEYRVADDEHINSLGQDTIVNRAYRNMYGNLMENYEKHEVSSDGTVFDVQAVLGTLFVTVSITIACASFLAGLIIQFLAVKDVGTRYWARYGLGAIIPLVLIFGTLLYTGRFSIFFT